MKTRSWPKGTKLGAMAAKVAQEHGMKLSMSAELQKIELPHYDQHAESDLHMLLRLGKRYDMAVKPVNGQLVLTKRGQGVNASGEPLPDVTVPANALTSWSWAFNARDAGGTVVAYFHAGKKGKRTDVSVGTGNPVKIIRHPCVNEAEAKAMAQAVHDERVRSATKVSLTLPGNPALLAESRLTVSGHARPELNKTWTIIKSHHTYEQGGYRTQVELELPLTEAEVEVANKGVSTSSVVSELDEQ